MLWWLLGVLVAVVVMLYVIGVRTEKKEAKQLFPENPVPAPTLAQQYALACGATVTVLNRYYVNSLTTGLSEEYLKDLMGWWDFTDRPSALRTMEQLRQHGHRQYVDLVLAVMNNHPPEAWDDQLDDVADARGLDVDLIDLKDNVVAGLARLRETGLLQPGDSIPSILGWDLGRMINIGRWCYDLGFITEAKAWAFIRPAAHRLQQTYRSWKALSLGYVLGHHLWTDNGAFRTEVEAVHRSLVGQPRSPWRSIPWTTPLD